ncbi:MAG: penicillin-binding protein activator [Devosiaceae bacterium]|nr:penicillin-binding protein activator [Devosiaceae bacterium MH13]
MAGSPTSPEGSDDRPVGRSVGVNRRTLAKGAGLASLLGLAACGPQGITGLGGRPTQPLAGPTPSIQPQGEILGNGSARVALLLPLTATGNAGQVGPSFRNAADMAIAALGGDGITVIVKDTGGTPQGAAAAASQALAEGVQMVLGPIFAAEVRAVGGVTQAAGVPVIAFSSDATVANSNVRLLSFLPSSDARRIVNYAVAQNRTSMGALLPNNAYGQIMEAEMRQAAANAGLQVAVIQRYDLTTIAIQAAANEIAQQRDRFNALFVPEAGDVMVSIAQGLASGGLTPQNTLFLGSGQWEDARVQNSPALAGAVYPAPPRAQFQDYVTRYRARYNSEPVRISSLGYDAVTLAAALARAGNGRIDPAMLSASSGFSGIDGIFRFLSNGVSQRGLAVYRVTGAGTEVASAAPRSFQGEF